MIYDYLIVGAGVIGASTAYFLKKQQPSSKILLIDQFKRVGLGNTSKSAALFRDLFGSAMSSQLASSSIEFYKTIGDKIGLNPIGYGWMLPKSEYDALLPFLTQLNQISNNFDLIEPQNLPPGLKIGKGGRKEFPAIHKILHGKNCGAFSAVKLARYYGNQFKALGGEFIHNTRIVGFTLQNNALSNPPWKENSVIKAINEEGNYYKAKKFISAVGAWTGELLTPLGIAPGVYPKRRQLFALKLEEAEFFTNNFIEGKEGLPAIILPAGGVYIKPVMKEKILVVGCAEQLGCPFTMGKFPPDADLKYFEDVIKPVLESYFPSLGNYSIVSKWAGYYSYYWPDSNPVIEQVANVIWVAGTSGSGIMKADSIGRIVAAKAQEIDHAVLYDNTTIKVSDLSLKTRNVEPENFVI